jgi:ParB family transcriptional regulator, chromosome partitioning protein
MSEFNKPLSMKERAAKVGQGVVAMPQPDTGAPTTAIGISGNMMAKAHELEIEIQRLRSERGVNKLPLDKLHIVEKRKRNLSEEEYIELRENIRKNGLVTPITVERRADGEWDVVSGSHRVLAFRDLERTEIPAYELEAGEGEGDAKAFYANLLHPSLPDFEKYLGFKAIMTERGISQSQMASESGLHKVTIGKIMSYDKLPPEAIEIIKQHPLIIGANTAIELAAITEEGGSARVIAAIKDVAFRGVTQSAAVTAAKRLEAKEKPKAEVQSFIIKSGRSKYAEIRGADNTLRIDFKDAKTRENFAVIIHDLIHNTANEQN